MIRLFPMAISPEVSRLEPANSFPARQHNMRLKNCCCYFVQDCVTHSRKTRETHHKWVSINTTQNLGRDDCRQRALVNMAQTLDSPLSGHPQSRKQHPSESDRQGRESETMTSLLIQTNQDQPSTGHAAQDVQMPHPASRTHRH